MLALEYRPKDSAGQQNSTPVDEAPDQTSDQVPDQAEPPKKGWRSLLKVHPAADLFPMIGPDELRALGEDIKANGMTRPIVIWYPGADGSDRKIDDCLLLDGRNRLDALEAVGVEIEESGTNVIDAWDYSNNDVSSDAANGKSLLAIEFVSELGSTSQSGHHFPGIPDPYAYVISANIHRRHLKPEERVTLIRDVKAKRPELSIRAIAEITGTPKSTVADALKEDGSGVRTRTPEEKKVKGRDGKSYSAKVPKKEKSAEAAAATPEGIGDAAGPKDVPCPSITRRAPPRLRSPRRRPQIWEDLRPRSTISAGRRSPRRRSKSPRQSPRSPSCP